MDTFMTLTAYGTDAQTAVDAAADEITRLDAILSTGDSESEIYQINQQGGGILSEDTAYLVERSLSLYQETDGAFDIAIYPVMEAWGFTTDEFRVPEEGELEELLTRCDAGEIQYDPESKEITFGMEGMRIDLGGIAKGYTSGRIMDIFREYGITSGLVNLGGNVQTCGTKTDGSLWRVAVQDPADSEEYIGILSVSDQAVITSGGYERYFEEDGRTYHHIIDPTTGYPAENGLISVTVISSDGTLADGLSTSLYIMGLEQAVSYWESRQDLFDMVLMTDDREIYVTEGIAEQFASDYEWNRITGNEDWK
jgi:thiamine biosynthesis lipoprotein